MEPRVPPEEFELPAEIVAEVRHILNGVSLIVREKNLAGGQLLTAREVAEHLSVTPHTVLRWAGRGELPSFKIRFRRDEINAWLEARRSNRG